jgi:hypothetical protein
MTLPTPPNKYDPVVESERNRNLELADKANIKHQQDIALVSSAKLILYSPNGARWNITVSNAGVIAAVAL